MVPSETPDGRDSMVSRFSMGRLLKAVGIVLFCVVVIIGAVLIGLSRWTRRTFGVVTIPQVLLNLDGAGTEGGGGAGLVRSGIVWGLIVPTVSAVIVLAAAFWFLKSLRHDGGFNRLLAVGTIGALTVIPVVGVRDTAHSFSLVQYIRAARSPEQLADYYIAPSNDQLPLSALKNSPNLVVIYMESIEDDMADDSLFELNMLEDLQRETEDWERIEGFQQYPGGGFTMSGIVSTQCGIPLRNGDVAAGDGNGMNDFGAEVSDYLPGAVCLGDLLEQRGYASVFMGGASGEFSGKKRYFQSHGYSQFYGLEDWVDAGETELRPDWGLSDARLFQHAKVVLDELYAADQPFNLTVLTLDTHPGVFVHDSCAVTTEDPAVSVYRCSTDYVADFVSYMKDKGYLDDTVVIVMGDHLKQVGEGNAFHDELADIPSTRTVFNRIWSPDDFAVVASVDQFGMFATTLDLLGYNLDKGRAGVGVSAFYLGDDADTIRALDREEYVDLIHSRSAEFYDMLWQQPSIHTQTQGEAEG